MKKITLNNLIYIILIVFSGALVFSASKTFVSNIVGSVLAPYLIGEFFLGAFIVLLGLFLIGYSMYSGKHEAILVACNFTLTTMAIVLLLIAQHSHEGFIVSLFIFVITIVQLVLNISSFKKTI